VREYSFRSTCAWCTPAAQPSHGSLLLALASITHFPTQCRNVYMCAVAYTNNVPGQCHGHEAASERCMTQSRIFSFCSVCKGVRVEASMRAVHQPHGRRTAHCCEWQLQSHRCPLSVEAFLPQQVKLRCTARCRGFMVHC
jgi:hypothetical protein